MDVDATVVTALVPTGFEAYARAHVDAAGDRWAFVATNMRWEGVPARRGRRPDWFNDPDLQSDEAPTTPEGHRAQLEAAQRGARRVTRAFEQVTVMTWVVGALAAGALLLAFATGVSSGDGSAAIFLLVTALVLMGTWLTTVALSWCEALLRLVTAISQTPERQAQTSSDH